MRSTLKLANVATPFTAVAVAGPARAPPPGFTAIATVTLPANPVALLPRASRAVTWTAGVIAAPAEVVVGSTVNASAVAGPGATLNDALATPASPGALAASAYPVPARLMLRLEKVATPPTAATVAAPDSVPPFGLAPIETVTSPVKPGVGFPSPSRAVTCTAGAIAAPAVLLAVVRPAAAAVRV